MVPGMWPLLAPASSSAPVVGGLLDTPAALMLGASSGLMPPVKVMVGALRVMLPELPTALAERSIAAVPAALSWALTTASLSRVIAFVPLMAMAPPFDTMLV